MKRSWRGRPTRTEDEKREQARVRAQRHRYRRRNIDPEYLEGQFAPEENVINETQPTGLNEQVGRSSNSGNVSPIHYNAESSHTPQVSRYAEDYAHVTATVERDRNATRTLPFEPDTRDDNPAPIRDYDNSACVEGGETAAFNDVAENTTQTEDSHDKDIVDEVFSFLGKCRMSKATANKIYQFFVIDNREAINEAAQDGRFPKGRTIDYKLTKTVPRILHDVYYKDSEGCDKEEKAVLTLPKQLCLQPARLLKLCAYIPLSNLLTFIKDIHTNVENVTLTCHLLDLSSDGVELSRSGSKQLHVVSVRIKGCNTPYPWQVWQFQPGSHPSIEEIFNPVVEDVTKTRCSVRRICADGLEVQSIRGMKSCNGFHSCGLCNQRGTKAGSKSVYYPLNEKCSRRTHQDFVSLFNDHMEWFLLENMKKTEDLRMGVNKKSPLLNLQDFDIINQIPLDSMHLIHLGITKKMWERIFETGSKVFHNAARRMQVQRRWNAMFTETKLPFELKHKTQPVNIARMKASELQTLDMLAFAAMALQLEGPEMLRKAMFTYCFLVRALYIDNVTFTRLEQYIDMDKLLLTFLKSYQAVFGKEAFSHNIHHFSHVLETRRKHGPMYWYNTAPFESMYGQFQYESNTNNVPKQILQNYLTFTQHEHKCYVEKNFRFKAQASEKTDDSIVYIRDAFYRVEDINDPHLVIRKIKTRALDTSAVVKLPWRLLGVRHYVEETSLEHVTVHKDDVKAKGIKCGDLISSFKPEWFVR